MAELEGRRRVLGKDNKARVARTAWAEVHRRQWPETELVNWENALGSSGTEQEE